MLGNQFDIAGQFDLTVRLHHRGDVASAWYGEIVERADAQRVTEVAKRFERDTVRRPSLERIGTVGHQKMTTLLVEIGKSNPAFASLVPR